MVVAKVLVAQRDAENPLPHQRLHLMLGKARIARVGDARHKPAHQAQPAIDLAGGLQIGRSGWIDVFAIDNGAARAALGSAASGNGSIGGIDERRLGRLARTRRPGIEARAGGRPRAPGLRHLHCGCDQTNLLGRDLPERPLEGCSINSSARRHLN
jgi:hypothetical protein